MTSPSRPSRPTSRQQAREQTMQRILEIARAQLEAQGVAGLSLREVTRELGMVSSAVYRYVSGRDELLTLLLVDAFDDLAESVDAALGLAGPAPQPGGEPDVEADPAAPAARQRLLDLALAMRSWALAHRAQWTLLYGTPVAEYHAPAETTVVPGTRVIGRVLEIVVAAAIHSEAGDDCETSAASEASTSGPAGARSAPADTRAAAPATSPLSTELAELLGQTAAELGRPGATTAQLLAAATFFSGTVGALNAELFTQWGPQFEPHGAELFTVQTRLLAQAVAG